MGTVVLKLEVILELPEDLLKDRFLEPTPRISS